MPNMFDGATGPGIDSSEDKCARCGKQHDDPKPPEFSNPVKEKKAGWERDKSMADVFDEGDSERLKIYKDGKMPDYGTEGHHCLAYSSFAKNGGEEFLRLNHYLDAAGFHPNDPPNIIQLPGRKGNAKAPAGMTMQYQNFWASVEDGKPLQLHIGRHKSSYFARSDNLVRRLNALITDPKGCEKKEDDLKDKLKKHADGAVNYAFMCVARAKWKCHPEKLRMAQSEYARHGGTKSTSDWTSIKLTIWPFK